MGNFQKKSIMQRLPWIHVFFIGCAKLHWVIPVAGWGLWIAGVRLPEIVALLCLLGSFLTFMFYCEDKFLAGKDLRRIPESDLHLWELFWGWPGALAAQKIIRHKNRKISYLMIFMICVVINIIMTWGIFRYGSNDMPDRIRENSGQSQ